MFISAATVETEVNEFRKSEIYPLIHNVFMSHDFATHADKEGEDCEQNTYITTPGRNRL